ncbi:MAG: hypothetical protein ABSE77_03055 [Acidimicrobiales bacterium]|jgi:hypothetical protein
MPEPTNARTTTSTSSAKPKVTGAAKTAEFSAAVRDEILASVKQAQQFTLDAMTTWVDVMGKVVPELPAFPYVPERAVVVESLGTAFEMAEELLATQRKFATDLVSALVPAS